MRNRLFVTDQTSCKVDMNTGECKELKTVLTKHIEDFFCMYMTAWDDFKDSEGVLKTVFTWCILVSELSQMGKEPEGNWFDIKKLLRYVHKQHKEKSDASIRMTVNRLVSRGFLIKSEERGCYFINPKYGIKGSISDKSYLSLTIAAKN